MGKLPAFQFYPADWRKDPGVQSLSFHDRGVWLEIICLMHESEQRGRLLLNGKPMPDEALARLLGLDKQIVTKTVSTLLEYGVASKDPETGALTCRRMVRDENLRIIRQTAGKLGGNPVLLKQKTTTRLNQTETTRDKQKPTPSSSSSTSSSEESLNAREAVGGLDWGENQAENFEDAELEQIARSVQAVTGLKVSSWQIEGQIKTAAIELKGQGFSAEEILLIAQQKGDKTYRVRFIATDMVKDRADLANGAAYEQSSNGRNRANSAKLAGKVSGAGKFRAGVEL